MSSKIKIARSISRASLPVSLDYGEPAYVKNVKFVVGNGDSTEFIVNDWNNILNRPDIDSSGDIISGVTSVNGRDGVVTLTKSDVSLGSVENVALSTWTGSSNITTVGTIGSGVWNGGVIPGAYGGTGLAFIGGDNQILGINGSGTALEYKTLSSSNGTITITNTLDSISLSVTAGNYLSLSGGTIAGDLTVTGNIYASRNDVVDFVDASSLKSVEYGRVYIRAPDYRVIVSTEYNQIGILGIASDTFGMSVGQVKGIKQVPIAIAGFVLAFVDKVYVPGTPLTCTIDGVLTKILAAEKKAYPERIVATFDKPESADTWNNVQVLGRCWVKVV